LLNRHAIVLLVGNASLTLLRPFPPASYGILGAGLLLVGLALLLDNGEPGVRSHLSHAMALLGATVLLGAVVRSLAAGSSTTHFALAQIGICLAVVGLVLELELPYLQLKTAIAVQGLGDLLYLGAFASGISQRTQTPSTTGWVFILLIGALGIYAAFSNLVLQLKRLRNPQAGWRFRVIGQDERALRLVTPSGEIGIHWSEIEGVRRLNGRQLLLVLPSPLPELLADKGLPVEELHTEPGIVDPRIPPERYGLILHEQEIGLSLSDAESRLGAHLATSNRAT